MTRVTFHTEAGRITGFEARGHSGWAEAGEDLLCASITAAVTLVAPTVNDVLGLAAEVRTDEKKALLSLRLPCGLGPVAESTCQSLLTGLMLYFTMLHDEYPENIEVLEAE
ncbi:MAG: ribosomal-processing cysteine protease Prp [Dysosmobacter sp.]|nr:ribosomal-processing cysteine protease Prp [Dysosmobacter sp.]